LGREKKITGEHQGSLKFKEGSLTFKSKTLTNGSFTVDMTTLTNTDADGKRQKKTRRPF